MGRLALAGSVLAILACSPADSSRRMVLVTFDSVRTDRLASYGAGASMMPTLDRLATEGMTFTQAWSPAPLTLPALAGMLSGRIPSGIGVVDDEGSMLAGDAPRIAPRLLAGGWATGMFTNAPFLDETSGVHEGFRRVYNPTSGGYTRSRNAPELFGEALDFLTMHRKVPAFVWIHVHDTHYPYLGAGVTGDGAERYDAALLAADEALAGFLDGLEERDLQADTVLVLAADHGEGLGDDGEMTHGLTLAPSTLQIPLVVSGVGIKPGQRTDAPVSLMDVAPTLADLAGLGEALENGPLDGRSLDGLLQGGEADPDRALYAETFVPFMSYHWPPLRQILTSGQARSAEPGRDGVPAAPDLGPQPVHDPGGEDRAAIMAAAGTIAAALANSRLDEAEAGLARWPQAGRSTPMWARMMAALRRSQGRPDDALAVLHQAATTSETCTDLWHTLASLEHELGRPSAASWQKTADLSGLRLRFRLQLAENLLREGRPAEAMTAARAAAAGRPASASLDAALGRIFLAAGQPREAQRLLAEAAVQAPGSAATYRSLAEAALMTGNGSGAMDLLQEALRIDPSERSIQGTIGNIHAAEGRLDEARAAWRLSLPPDLAEPGASLAVAEAFLRRGQFDETAAEVDRVRVKYPDDPQAHYIMGQVALATGNPDGAIEELLSSLSTGGEQATIYFYLARASLMKDDEKSALEYLERVFATDDPTLRRALQAERLLTDRDRYPQVTSAVERYLAGANPSGPAQAPAAGSNAP
jgi:choline-sulfatase